MRISLLGWCVMLRYECGGPVWVTDGSNPDRDGRM
jgi:hypothetical protein